VCSGIKVVKSLGEALGVLDPTSTITKIINGISDANEAVQDGLESDKFKKAAKVAKQAEKGYYVVRDMLSTIHSEEIDEVVLDAQIAANHKVADEFLKAFALTLHQSETSDEDQRNRSVIEPIFQIWTTPLKSLE
jgi:hypothetical protein